METKICHFAGLVYGDFDGPLFAEAARHGKVAVDVQCLLRHVEPDKTMAFHDWAEKREYLPCIDYLKTDAAEAEILTGLTDRAEAARLLHSWGAGEVLITHNTEVLAYDAYRFQLTSGLNMVCASGVVSISTLHKKSYRHFPIPD